MGNLVRSHIHNFRSPVCVLIAVFAFLNVIPSLSATSDAVLDDSGIGLTASYSVGFATRRMRSLFPVVPIIYGRFFDIVELGILGGYSGSANSYSAPILGAELRFAPRLRFYSPHVGIGLSYMRYVYEYSVPKYPIHTSVLSYLVMAPLRFSIRSIFARLGIRNLHLTVSVFEIRYGPIIPDGTVLSWDKQGNFLLSVDLARLGVLMTF